MNYSRISSSQLKKFGPLKTQRLIVSLGIEPRNGTCLAIDARGISRRKLPIEDIHASYENAGPFQFANLP